MKARWKIAIAFSLVLLIVPLCIHFVYLAGNSNLKSKNMDVLQTKITKFVEFEDSVAFVLNVYAAKKDGGDGVNPAEPTRTSYHDKATLLQNKATELANVSKGIFTNFEDTRQGIYSSENVTDETISRKENELDMARSELQDFLYKTELNLTEEQKQEIADAL